MEIHTFLNYHIAKVVRAVVVYPGTGLFGVMVGEMGTYRAQVSIGSWLHYQWSACRRRRRLNEFLMCIISPIHYSFRDENSWFKWKRWSLRMQFAVFTTCDFNRNVPV